MSPAGSTDILPLARNVASRYAAHSEVESVVLGGSRASGTADPNSDIDLYVYVHRALPLDARCLAAEPCLGAEIGNNFWEPGDEWIDAPTGIHLDVMFRDPRWIEDRLASVLERHQASIGYTTCFWYNVLHSQILFDRGGWFTSLQRSADRPYPAALKVAIIAKNFPILRRNQSSYIHQLELALNRADPVSLNHRTTALLASYFDILFAVNELPHPGEKRLILYAERHCPKLPKGFPGAIAAMVEPFAPSGPKILENANTLIDGLEVVLKNESLI
jgi:hypothetical protein